MSRRKFKSNIPEFESQFLKSVADAFAKRKKAIIHRVGQFSMKRDIDTRDTVELERLHAEFKESGSWSTAFYLTVWEHAKAWICVRELKKRIGATFLVKFGTELWDVEPEDIVRRSEMTIGLMKSLRPANAEDEIRKLWAAGSASNKPPPKNKRGR